MLRRKKQIRHAKIVDVFAERLRALREARGMSQRELARRAHVTVTYIPRLENSGAAPGIDLVERLADSLGVHVMELLPLANPETTDEQREQTKGLFALVLAKAGRETLTMLNVCLHRLSESTSVGR
jgi:transcriptional regulator with XRE-family HTH domain